MPLYISFVIIFTLNLIGKHSLKRACDIVVCLFFLYYKEKLC